MGRTREVQPALGVRRISTAPADVVASTHGPEIRMGARKAVRGNQADKAGVR